MNRRDLLIGAGAAGLGLALRPNLALAGHANVGNLPYGGVCTHILNKAQYFDTVKVGQYLRHLETKLARDEWCPPGTGYDGFKRRLDTIQVEHPSLRWVFVTGRAIELSHLPTVLDQMEPYVTAGVIAAVEGPNEWNLSGRATWKEELSTYTKELWRQVRARPAFDRTPVLAPALAYPKDSGPYFGDHSQWVNLTNLHFYQPSYQVDTRYLGLSVDGANAVAPGKGMVCTEVNGQIGDEIVRSDGYKPTEADQAWCYETILYHLGKGTTAVPAGVHRAFCYQLCNWVGMYDSITSEENQYGCFRKDWSRKPLADKVLVANRRG